MQQVCRCIEAAGKAGLRGLNYNFLVSNLVPLCHLLSPSCE